MIGQRKVPPVVFWGIVVAAILLGCSLIAVAARENRLGKEMYGACMDLTGALSEYETEHDGAPPRTIQELVSDGYLETLPINPYTGERLFVLSSVEKPRNGGIRYMFLEDEITQTAIETTLTVYGRFGMPVLGPYTVRYIK